MSIFETNEAAVKAAKEFFSTKTPRNFYKISVLQDDILNEVNEDTTYSRCADRL